MQVSAVTANSSHTVFNTRANSRTLDGCEVAILKKGCLNSDRFSSKDNRSELFDSINEWKNFCHAQIEKGNFDVII